MCVCVRVFVCVCGITSFIFIQILFDENENVIGIATNDMGIGKDGSKKDTFQPGVELKGSIFV